MHRSNCKLCDLTTIDLVQHVVRHSQQFSVLDLCLKLSSMNIFVVTRCLEVQFIISYTVDLSENLA